MTEQQDYGFIYACIEAKNDFVKVSRMFTDTDTRVRSENLIIMFDQLVDKLRPIEYQQEHDLYDFLFGEQSSIFDLSDMD